MHMTQMAFVSMALGATEEWDQKKNAETEYNEWEEWDVMKKIYI